MSVSSPLVAALLPLIDALEHLGVGYFIGGSLASAAHGVARATIDADLVADLRADHVAPLVRQLSSAYYLDEARVASAVAHRRTFNAIHLATMVKVDVFVLKARAFDHRELARAVEARIGEASTRTFRFASAEDIVLAKLEWFRAGGDVSDRQWSDVVNVVRVRGSNFDWAYTETWCDALGVADLVERLKHEAAGL